MSLSVTVNTENCAGDNEYNVTLFSTAVVGGDHIATIEFDGPRGIFSGICQWLKDDVPLGTTGSFLFTSAGETYELKCIVNKVMLATLNGDNVLTLDYHVDAIYAPAWAMLHDVLVVNFDEVSCCAGTGLRERGASWMTAPATETDWCVSQTFTGDFQGWLRIGVNSASGPVNAYAAVPEEVTGMGGTDSVSFSGAFLNPVNAALFYANAFSGLSVPVSATAGPTGIMTTTTIATAVSTFSKPANSWVVAISTSGTMRVSGAASGSNCNTECPIGASNPHSKGYGSSTFIPIPIAGGTPCFSIGARMVAYSRQQRPFSLGNYCVCFGSCAIRLLIDE